MSKRESNVEQVSEVGSPSKKLKIEKPTKPFKSSNKNPLKNTKNNLTEKPEDWNEFKKKKKILKLKRKKSKSGFDVITKAKKIGEKLRCKLLKGGSDERNKLINELHTMLKNQNHYSKFILAHDTSRIVQWLLKYGSKSVKDEISKEIIPVTLDMIQSKYGIFVLKRLLKYGNQETKRDIIDKFYGNAVKLCSHAVSSSVFEYAYTTWANPLQKQHLIQEFYGDIYKNHKDNNVKCLNDVFIASPDLKVACLSAIKANLSRVLNKDLLDSSLIQSVIYQFFLECKPEDKAELITQLAPHIVVISNSRDGSRVAMQIIWNGTNKDKKVAMKSLKEHAVELSKHEHGHCTIITLLDGIDDTVLLHKIILGELLKNSKILADNEWGRKVLVWLVAPNNTTYYHPTFIKELEIGRQQSNCKKSIDIRQKEILNYSIDILLELIYEQPDFWLEKPSIALEMFYILKAGNNCVNLQKAYESIIKKIVQINWKIKKNQKEIYGIEDGGFHMIFKKLSQQNDQIKNENNQSLTFNECLINYLTNDVLEVWLSINRGCFLLLTIYENCNEKLRKLLQDKLLNLIELLNKQKTIGANILLKKINN